jgi:hypothetical protein
VDDNIIVGPTGSFIAELNTAIDKRFNVKNLGMVSWLLGMIVERECGSHTIKIGQRQYVWICSSASTWRIAS